MRSHALEDDKKRPQMNVASSVASNLLNVSVENVVYEIAIVLNDMSNTKQKMYYNWNCSNQLLASYIQLLDQLIKNNNYHDTITPLQSKFFL